MYCCYNMESVENGQSCDTQSHMADRRPAELRLFGPVVSDTGTIVLLNMARFIAVQIRRVLGSACTPTLKVNNPCRLPAHGGQARGMMAKVLPPERGN